ncbi:PREDICTED: neuromedin-K receptor-like [Papilio polytes]|uniref:neuromedin-K receptor-like n=1 Tax=Papilio polytes TaxID=76194 RepID=UPI000675E112|nr:PREDICTED: neuromedin-K receptor-like [Papilio polytes]
MASSLNNASIDVSGFNDTGNNFFVTFYDVDKNAYINDTGNYTEEYQPFVLPVGRQVLWSILFCIIVVAATFGNFVVIWIVAVNKRMRTVTNYLLVNLSLADAMISTLNVTINFVYMLYSHWPFGYFYCKFNQFIAVVSISASVFTLMAISIDRYMAIVNPLRPRLGKRATLGIMTAIWLGSALLGSPNLVYFKTDFDYLPDGSVREVCYSEWPDGLTTRSEIEYIYNVIFMMVTYFIPIIAMTYTYARIGRELWGSKSIGESSQRQADNVKSKRRVVKMMIVIVVIFAVCWLPFHVYFIITSNYPEVTNYPPIQEIYLAIYWLAMSNSMLNPIILYWMNIKFRRGFRQFIRCCCAFGDKDARRQGMYELQHLDRSLHSYSPTQKNGTSTVSVSIQSFNNPMENDITTKV